MTSERTIDAIYLCQAYKNGEYVPAFRVRYADGSSQLYYAPADCGLYWLHRVVDVFFNRTSARTPAEESESKYAPGGLKV